MSSLPAAFGPYRVVRQLGEGGMGVVYEGVHDAIRRRVAIKVLHPEFARSPEVSTRFLNEARAVNIVEHPGLVQVFDYGQISDGAAYIVMEYLKGETLARRLELYGGKLPMADALQLAWQLADSLAMAHDKGIIHRDLKPQNIMLVPDSHMAIGERAKILDFGLAKLTDPQGNRLVKTSSNAVMGTPLYMSPEQCAGAGKVDARSDVYSLGCILYEMLGGRPPFIAEGAGQVLGMHMFKEAASLRTLSPKLPAELGDLVDRLPSKDREQRPTMKELAQDLEAWSNEMPPPPRSRSDKITTEVPRRRRRRRRRLILGASVLLAGVIAVSLSLRAFHKPVRQPIVEQTAPVVGDSTTSPATQHNAEVGAVKKQVPAIDLPRPIEKQGATSNRPVQAKPAKVVSRRNESVAAPKATKPISPTSHPLPTRPVNERPPIED